MYLYMILYEAINTLCSVEPGAGHPKMGHFSMQIMVTFIPPTA